MRLTLRTMLAYMDDILEPEDAKALGKKIEESEFASNLLARARDVMRRLRLGAPSVGERGAVLDPNTVAEYLDNTLSSERVPDFEKVCLESDVHLAEVAACHQILTLVLGEPAEVDPESRQQMYQLPAVVAAKEKEEEAAATAAASAAGDGKEAAVTKEKEKPKTSPPTRPAKPTVPDYLREPATKRRFWPVAAALFLAGFFLVVILAALGQFEPGTPLGQMLGLGSGDQAVVKGPDEPVVPETPAGQTPPPTEELKQPGVAKPGGPADKVESPEEPAEKAPTPEDVEAAPKPPAVGEVAPEVPAAPLPGEAPQPEPGPGPMPGPEPGPEAKPIPPKPDTVDMVAKPPVPEVAPGPPEVKPEPKPADEVLGRLVSERQVLVRFDPAQSHWTRVPALANVSAGQTLLVLPTYRPMLALTAMTVQLIGGTEATLSAVDENGTIGLGIPYGKVVLRSVGKAGVQVRVGTGGIEGTVTLVDPDSAAAISVSRKRIEGADPELQPDPVLVELYAAAGRVGWTPVGADAPITLDSSNVLPLGGPPAQPTRLAKLPAWIDTDTSGVLDRSASTTIEQSLPLDRPTQLTLKELLEHRKREVRWLAMRCLGYFGDFDAFIVALNDPDERLAWPDYIDLLQKALDRGTPAVLAIRRAAEKRFGQEGAALARMLYGYTDEELKGGDAARLVGYLDHEDLGFRVLSFWNLKGITGWGLFYQPEAPEARRKQSVQKWRERLDSGAILRSKEGTPEEEPPAPEPVTPKGPVPPADPAGEAEAP